MGSGSKTGRAVLTLALVLWAPVWPCCCRAAVARVTGDATTSASWVQDTPQTAGCCGAKSDARRLDLPLHATITPAGCGEGYDGALPMPPSNEPYPSRSCKPRSGLRFMPISRWLIAPGQQRSGDDNLLFALVSSPMKALRIVADADLATGRVSRCHPPPLLPGANSLLVLHCLLLI